MIHLSFIIIFFASLSVHGQISVKGKLLDYEKRIPLSNIKIIVDSLMDFSTESIANGKSNNDGTFVLNLFNSSNTFNILFLGETTDALIIKNISTDTGDTIDLCNIYLFKGSNQTETGKYCKGIIEKNIGKDRLLIKYPKDGINKNFLILEKALLIDFNEFNE